MTVADFSARYRWVAYLYKWSGDRVVEETDEGTWKYDEDLDTDVATPSRKTWHYVYDAKGFFKCRVSGAERDCVRYDAQHRVVNDGSEKLSYDGRGRLTVETEPDHYVDRWKYDCGDEPPGVAALFVPRPRDQIGPCVSACARRAAKNMHAPETAFFPGCRALCENVGDPEEFSPLDL